MVAIRALFLLFTSLLALANSRSNRSLVEILDGEGKSRLSDLDQTPDNALLEVTTNHGNQNRYFLFTRENRFTADELRIHSITSVRNSHFNPQVSTVFIVHGWLSNQESNMNPAIRDAFLHKGSYNIIVVDWQRLASLDYITAVNGVPSVGHGIAQFLRFLCRASGITLESVHLVGFSLGAHIVGNAGRELQGQVARITGLDPSGPLWNLYSSQGLRRTDAVYVEAIHTDGQTVTGLGIGTPVADVDFFPNGGVWQPGCLTGICNHNRAWRYFASSVMYNHFLGQRCSNSMQMLLNRCRGSALHMGNADLIKFGSGIFRVNTQSRYPY